MRKILLFSILTLAACAAMAATGPAATTATAVTWAAAMGGLWVMAGTALKYVGAPVIIKLLLDISIKGKSIFSFIPPVLAPAAAYVMAIVGWTLYSLITGDLTPSQLPSLVLNILVTGTSTLAGHDIIETAVKPVVASLTTDPAPKP